MGFTITFPALTSRCSGLSAGGGSGRSWLSRQADGFPIVDLELAWTVEQADDVTRGADVGTIRSAILWDFVFMFFYALALVFG